MLFLKHALAVVPSISFTDRLVGCCGAFVDCDPVNSGEKFHAERCFKAGNEIDNPLKMVPGGRMIFKKTLRLWKNLGKQVDLPFRIVLRIAISANEMPFQGSTHGASSGHTVHRGPCCTEVSIPLPPPA